MDQNKTRLPAGKIIIPRSWFPVVRKSVVCRSGNKQTGIVWSVNVPNADIFFAANSVLGTIFIHATKLIEIVHDRSCWAKSLEIP